MTETKVVYPIGNYNIVLLQENDQSQNLICAALLILLVLTLTLNSFVLLSILGCPHRSSPHNAAIATVASVSLVDGVFNMTSSIVFHSSWLELPHFYGENNVRVWCRTNAALLQITNLILSFALAVLSYDRLSIVNDRKVGDFPSRRKQRVQTVLKWVLIFSVFGSVILTLPVSFGVLNSTLFEQRMSCNPAYASRRPESILIAVTILITYATTWYFILRNSYIILRKVFHERRRVIVLEQVARQRAAERGCPPRGISNLTSEWLGQFWGETNGEGFPMYILTSLLITSFMLTVVPNVIAVQVTQFYSAYEFEQEFYVLNRTFLHADLRQIRTNVYDSIFAWARHGFNILSPGLILFIHGEIRKQCKTNFCCCFIGENSIIKNQSRCVLAFIRDWKRRKNKKTVADYRTPVLFATSQGLHLRIIRGDSLEQEEPEFFFKFCDLTLDETCPMHKQQTPIEVKPREEFNEKTFIVKKDKSSRGQRLGETFVKYPKALDGSKNSRNRSGTIELGSISKNGSSFLSLSQSVKNRDS